MLRTHGPWIAVVTLLVLIGAGIWFFGMSPTAVAPETDPNTQDTPSPTIMGRLELFTCENGQEVQLEFTDTEVFFHHDQSGERLSLTLVSDQSGMVYTHPLLRITLMDQLLSLEYQDLSDTIMCSYKDLPAVPRIPADSETTLLDDTVALSGEVLYANSPDTHQFPEGSALTVEMLGVMADESTAVIATRTTPITVAPTTFALHHEDITMVEGVTSIVLNARVTDQEGTILYQAPTPASLIQDSPIITISVE